MEAARFAFQAKQSRALHCSPSFPSYSWEREKKIAQRFSAGNRWIAIAASPVRDGRSFSFVPDGTCITYGARLFPALMRWAIFKEGNFSENRPAFYRWERSSERDLFFPRSPSFPSCTWERTCLWKLRLSHRLLIRGGTSCCAGQSRALQTKNKTPPKNHLRIYSVFTMIDLWIYCSTDAG